VSQRWIGIGAEGIGVYVRKGRRCGEEGEGEYCGWKLEGSKNASKLWAVEESRRGGGVGWG